jgi:hypothetical protein
MSDKQLLKMRSDEGELFEAVNEGIFPKPEEAKPIEVFELNHEEANVPPLGVTAIFILPKVTPLQIYTSGMGVIVGVGFTVIIAPVAFVHVFTAVPITV